MIAERLHYPIGRAAALEACGVSAEGIPPRGPRSSPRREEAWRALDRPLEATRARLLAGQVLASHDPERSRDPLEGAATESERLGWPTWPPRRAWLRRRRRRVVVPAFFRRAGGGLRGPFGALRPGPGAVAAALRPC